MAETRSPRRVVVRRLRDTDADAWFALHADPQVMARIVDPLSVDAAGRSFTAALAGNARMPPKRRTWGIEADGGFAGVIGLVFDGPASAELGAILTTDAQGRGVATRALALVVAEAFSAYALQRVHTRHDDGHAGAAGLMRALGFECVASEPVAKGWRWERTTPIASPRAEDSLEPIR